MPGVLDTELKEPLLILRREGKKKSATGSLFPPATWGPLPFLPAALSILDKFKCI